MALLFLRNPLGLGMSACYFIFWAKKEGLRARIINLFHSFGCALLSPAVVPSANWIFLSSSTIWQLLCCTNCIHWEPYLQFFWHRTEDIVGGNGMEMESTGSFQSPCTVGNGDIASLFGYICRTTGEDIQNCVVFRPHFFTFTCETKPLTTESVK